MPIAVVVLLVGALLAIPVVIGGNGGTTAAACGELSVILDTIRTIESGGDYTASEEPRWSIRCVSVHRQHLERLRGLRLGLPRAARDPRCPSGHRRTGDPRHLRRRRLRPRSSGTGLAPQPTRANSTSSRCQEQATGSPSASTNNDGSPPTKPSPPRAPRTIAWAHRHRGRLRPADRPSVDRCRTQACSTSPTTTTQRSTS